MGLFGKLFGGKTLDERKVRAERLIEDGDWGGAKIELERALEKAADAGDDVREDLVDRIDECCDAIARARIEEGARLIEQGDLELARMELGGALEVAASDEVKEAAQELVDELERDEAVEQAMTDDVTDEERWVLISGSWNDAQADEYEEYGDALVDALLTMHAGELEDAKPLLEAILDDAEAPRYLWREIGRVRLGTDDQDGGRDALIEFVDSLAEDEVGEPLLAAYIELARIAADDEEIEEAMELYQRAIDQFEHDPRPYLAMGVFLREQGHLEEAISVLEAGASLMDDIRPDWLLMQELGHAYADNEQAESAIGQLEAVISFFTSRQHLDFPVRTARKLAELHEESGKLDRAADLWAALTKGSDVEKHALYHREAGRLLAALELTDEAKRMLKRGLAIADDDDDEMRASLQEHLDAL